MKIGERVVAIYESNDTEVLYFGTGVYTGDFLPEDALGPLAEYTRTLKFTNPRIELDDGGHVWGCECWWGPEEATRERYKDLKWVLVSIDDLRAGLKDD